MISIFAKKRWSSLPDRTIDTIAVLLIAIAAIVIAWKMIRDGVNGLGDLSWHMTWIQHFTHELTQTIYPRWLARTNYGYGSPTFVFYPPLVYYLGAFFRLLGFDIQRTIAALCTIALFTSGCSFYLYSRKWGRVAALSGAIFYLSAPQLTNLVYFGGIAAMFAQPLMPLGLYLTDRAIERSRWMIALAVFWGVMALTHVPSLLLCTIAWTIYLLVLMLQQSWRRILPLFVAAGFGFGLASFFLLPAVLEQSFANIKALKAVNGGFQANMIGSGQLQLLPLGQITKMAYIYLHQGVAIAIFSTIAILCCWKQKTLLRQTWGALGFAIVLALMMSVLSTPIWQASPTLQMVQFPVRLLGMFALAGAILCAIAVRGMQKLRASSIFALIVAAVLIANFRYSLQLSRRLPTLNSPGQGKVVNLESIKAIVDNPYFDNLIDLPEYRPMLKNTDSTVPTPIFGLPPILQVTPPAASITLKDWSSLSRSFKIVTQVPTTVNLRIYYYLAWQARVNQQTLPLEMAKDGTIEIKLPPGDSEVELWYGWTPVFTIGVIVSSLSAIALISAWMVSSKVPQ